MALAVRTFAAISLWLLLPSWPAEARDYFLTIGGGFDPQGNQVSLERNVAFFQQVLAEQRTDRPPHDIYFADGADPHRDLQYRDPDFECSPGRRMAIELFGDADKLNIAYRNHALSGVRDTTSPRRIQERLAQLGRQMQSGDRLLVYVTAHGGAGDDRTPFNTSIYTWNHRQFRAADFERWLGPVPESVRVVVVMVQCYAGGFSRIIFNDGDPAQGLSRQLRAGFFAQLHDRPAAGCTPEVDKESYEEYSSFFLAALAGHDRHGGDVQDVDIDGDGHTSFAEAHAYAVCQSHTVDIPLRTSDAFLDYYSTDGSTGESAYLRTRDADEPRRLPPTELVRAEGSLPQLLLHADHIDRAIVLGLIDRLQLDVDGDVAQIRQARQRIGQQQSRAQRSAGRAASDYRRARERVKRSVLRQWPELDADLSPTLAALMAERADEFARQVAALADYQALVRLAATKESTNAEALDARKKEALAERLERAVERIVRAANLPLIAPPEVVERYRELVALESEGLVAP